MRALWHHSSPDYPALLYSELDDERWEVRKVEIFLDGRKGWASTCEESELTGLGTMPVPKPQ